MSGNQISKVYEPKTHEDSIYKQWEESGFFNPDNLPGKRKDTFTISMPPPNATGNLHLGHAIMLAIQDLVIRFQRMQGKKTLWLPGTDHASIATQNKVEKVIKAESGKTRHDLGREKFLERVEKFVAESKDTIRGQIRKMGSSCDWSRERYTLDEGLTSAVNYAFKEMYEDGLIYRGTRIVNWCPHCQSTLADDEVEYKEQKSPFYYFKYGPVIIGTARPETKFGDKVIIVHPDDKRYKDLVGKVMDVEWILGPIKATVVADKAADMAMGSGAMTITPAHSFVDFELAQKHGFDVEKIINEDGKLTQAAGELAGLSVKEARHKVVEILKKKGLVEKIDEDYVHNLSICYRCGTAIEPLPSKQWFINVNHPIKKFGNKTIKDRAVEVVKKGEIEIIPDHFNKVYYHWMENLRDWCISRQIWFGHRIPVWYKGAARDDQGSETSNQTDMYVGAEPPKGDGWVQDTDTLDTWFSSGLWTFSTLGWPEKTADFKTYHPTDLMETGYDILFFWVGRMIIMSTYFVEQVPFKQVYLHGLVRDEKGRKMSKSLENIIDPLDVIAKYGADATRLSLLIGIAPGNDSNLSEAKIEGYRNFVNKLWNISRYIIGSVKKLEIVKKEPKAKTLSDRWILSELNTLVEFSTKQLVAYNFSAVGERIYEFTWAKLADWYVEISKVEQNKDELLLYILQTLLKLWHPFTPYVSEVVWKNFSDDLLMIQDWPKANKAATKKDIENFKQLQQMIVAIRNLRSESNLSPSQRLPVSIIAPKDVQTLIEENMAVFISLARLDKVTFVTKKSAHALATVSGKAEIFIVASGTIDIKKELSRLTKEEKRVADFVEHLEQKLKDGRFLDRAPADIIEREKVKLADHKDQLEKIKQQLQSLQ